MSNQRGDIERRWTIATGPRVFGGVGRATGPATNGPVEVMPVSDHLERVEELEARLAECYRLSGEDPDGDDDAMLASFAVDAVRGLAREEDTQAERVEALQALLSEAIEEFERKARQAIADGGEGAFLRAEVYEDAADHLQQRLDELGTDGELMEGASPDAPSVADQFSELQTNSKEVQDLESANANQESAKEAIGAERCVEATERGEGG